MKEVSIILSYYRPTLTEENLTLSIDNVVLDLYISLPEAREKLMKLLSVLPIQYACDVIHWQSFRPGTFQEQFSIKLHDNTSFWIGAALNGKKTEYGRVRLDWNPNKVSNHAVFQCILRYLIFNTKEMQRNLRRIDLAVDLPVLRSNCFLIKDGRAYSERRHGEEYTQYLGAKSSTVGRVKLYNKQVESKLNYPLTRLEITLDPKVPYSEVPWPKVYYLNDLQMCFSELKATDTERFILSALLQGYGSLNLLGRKTREKIEKLMVHYVKYVEVSPKDYSAILRQLEEYISVDQELVVTESDRYPKLNSVWLPDWLEEVKESDMF